MSAPATAHHTSSSTPTNRATPPPPTTSASRIPVRTDGSPSTSYSPRTRFLPASTCAGGGGGAGSPESSAWSPSLLSDAGSPSLPCKRQISTSPRLSDAARPAQTQAQARNSPSSALRGIGGGGGGVQQKRTATQLAFLPPAAAAASEAQQPPFQNTDSSRSFPVVTDGHPTILHPLSRSKSLQSIDSVRLARALGLSADSGAGEAREEVIGDELPPFVVSDSGNRRFQTHTRTEKTMESAGPGSVEVPAALDAGEASHADPRAFTEERNTGPFPPLTNRVQSTGMDAHNGGTTATDSPLSQASNRRTQPQDQPRQRQQRATGAVVAAASGRQRKPSVTGKVIVGQGQSQSQVGFTPRSASAQELGRFASSSSLPNQASPPPPPSNSITTKKSNGGGGGGGLALASSSSTRELHSYYPAEAYLVPHIDDYRPTQGSASWDDTVIPTIAKRLSHATRGRERGKVGLGFFENGDERRNGDGNGEEVEDELVAEWTADGRPSKIVKVHPVTKSPVMAEQQPVGQEYIATSESQLGREGEYTKGTTLQPAPGEDNVSDHAGFTKGHTKGDSVLSDILAEYITEDQEPSADASARQNQGRADTQGGQDDQVARLQHTTVLGIAATRTHQGEPVEQSGPGPSSVHQNGASYPHYHGQNETTTGTNIGNQITTEPLPNMPTVTEEPSRGGKNVAPLIPVKEEQQQPARPSNSAPSEAQDGLLLPREGGRNGTKLQEGFELQNVSNDRVIRGKAVPITPSRTQKGKGKTEDGHGGGCRCIIM